MLRLLKQFFCRHKYPSDWYDWERIIDNPHRTFVCPKCGKKIKQKPTDKFKYNQF